MTVIQLKNGETCTHNHSERMVTLAKKWLLDYFSDGVARRSHDMERDLVGRMSFYLERLGATAFIPAIALLIDEGALVYGREGRGYFWYALPGNLPDGVKVITPGGDNKTEEDL